MTQAHDYRDLATSPEGFKFVAGWLGQKIVYYDLLAVCRDDRACWCVAEREVYRLAALCHIWWAEHEKKRFSWELGSLLTQLCHWYGPEGHWDTHERLLNHRALSQNLQDLISEPDGPDGYNDSHSCLFLPSLFGASIEPIDKVTGRAVLPQVVDLIDRETGDPLGARLGVDAAGLVFSDWTHNLSQNANSVLERLAARDLLGSDYRVILEREYAIRRSAGLGGFSQDPLPRDAWLDLREDLAGLPECVCQHIGVATPPDDSDVDQPLVAEVLARIFEAVPTQDPTPPVRGREPAHLAGINPRTVSITVSDGGNVIITADAPDKTHKGKKTATVSKRPWTQPDLNKAILEFKAQRAAAFKELVDALQSGRPGADKTAKELYGRNAIARALGVKSPCMVSRSPAWVGIARELGIPLARDRQAMGTRRTRQAGKIGMGMADEQKSAEAAKANEGTENAPAESVLEKAERQETLRQIQRLASVEGDPVMKAWHKMAAEDLCNKLRRDEMSDDEVRQRVESILNPNK
ncbi:MAG TPA: hypothetical protein PLP01_02335 [Phycisphaerae bacterium]|nr:hypothetical protein [Phycisphaerae bacterium]